MMSRGVHIFYKLLDQNDNKIRYAYSGGDFSDKEELVKAYDGIVVMKRKSLEIKEIDEIEYGVDYYQEKRCAATEESHNIQINSEDGTIVDRFALKVVFKVFWTYKEKDAIVY